MQIQENFSLLPYNTFRIDAKARYFSTFSTIDELPDLLTYDPKLPVLVLGGGSNILFTKDFNGLLIKNEFMGIEVLHEDEEHVYVRAGAGENWHRFVMNCIERNWAGVENLALIPGNVGASPMQNIGAYGVELSLIFWNLEAFHIREKKLYTFTENDCEFEYRESVFKTRHRDQFIILRVTLRLRKSPIFHTSYGAIQDELKKMAVSQLSIRAIAQAVINIRSSKLPDPAQIGNAGSFFKNPTISMQKYKELRSSHPGMIGFENVNGTVKLAAGWLIEQCGWKGYRQGDAGCHEKQALVLVNYGNAKGNEIYDLGEKIRLSVKEKFGVELETEVNII